MLQLRPQKSLFEKTPALCSDVFAPSCAAFPIELPLFPTVEVELPLEVQLLLKLRRPRRRQRQHGQPKGQQVHQGLVTS